MLTHRVQQSTVDFWRNSKWGTFHLPSATFLRSNTAAFGPLSLNHSFLVEPAFFLVSIYLLKGQWLDTQAIAQLIQSHLYLMELWKALVSLHCVPFHLLQLPDKDYATHTSIPSTRVQMFTACALYYNLDISCLIRFVGGNYTASYRNIDDIIKRLSATKICNKSLLLEVKRVMQMGVPPKLNAYSSWENLFQLW